MIANKSIFFYYDIHEMYRKKRQISINIKILQCIAGYNNPPDITCGIFAVVQ